ncbi:MAG: carboxypeptidase regulatory-like domain-containing protein [Candidatus Omnitrophica bacterium]|nr:carboxypeptidase regulatory-like domain-containing protein [Candidatus Omnitrophota bacterium]
MQFQYLLMAALVFIVLAVMGIIIFLPTASPPSGLDLIVEEPADDGGALSLTPPQTMNASDAPDAGDSNNAQTVPGLPTEPSGAAADAPSDDNPDAPAPTQTASSAEAAISDATTSQQQTIQPQIIAGTVKDPQGKPLQGVAVQIEGAPLILTKRQGEFRFDAVTQKTVSITCRLAGYQVLKRDDVPAGSTNLVLVMIPEGAVAGRVLDQFSDPIALAQIQARALQGIWAVDISADAEGRFLITESPQTRIRLQASQEGFTDSGSGAKEVDLPTSEEVILRLDRPTFSISGNVIAQDNQQGIPDFTLRAVLQDAGPNAEELTTKTDGTGMYRFDNLRQGTYIVSSLPSANSQRNYVIPLKDDSKSVRLYEKSATRVDFIAVAGLTVSGQVVDSNNQPVSSAEVTVAGLQSVQTMSNYQGQFRLTGVPVTGGQTMNRLEIRLQASHSDYGTGLSDPLPNQSDQEITGITITLQGLFSLNGRIVDGSDAPIADARITLRDLTLGQLQETVSNQLGEFNFSQVSAAQDALAAFSGTHEISAQKDGYSNVTRQIMLQPGRPQTITLTLEQGGVIQGRVLDPNSQPLAGVNVAAQLPLGGSISAVSDQFGVYYLAGLPEGAYDLTFRVDSDPPLTGVLYQVASGSTGADITLQVGKWDLMGTVENAVTDERIYQYMLSMEGTPKDPRGKPFSMTRSVNTPDGTYHITFTERGIYRIRFLADGYQPLEEKLDIDLNTMRLQYINPRLQPLQTTGRIQGAFAAPEGMTLAGVNIPGVGPFSTNGNSFAMEDIPTGNHDLIFHVFEEKSQSIFEIGVLMNIPVSAGQTTDIGRISPQKLTAQSRNY